MFWEDSWLLYFDGLLLVSIIAIASLMYRVECSLSSAPKLHSRQTSRELGNSISVIIPCFNEQKNIRECVNSVLNNRLDSSQHLELLIVDDQSTDSTKAIAEELAAIDNRIQTITVPPRPRNGWVGKNWACFQGASYARGNYILFIDADVRLESEAIASALVEAEKYKTDLLSCAPRIVCGCFWEWLIQPLIFNLISAGFDFTKVNNSNDSLAFATGTFMLFRRNAYLSIGGHRGVAGIVLEDVALATLIKNSGLKLRYILGLDFISVRMYENFPTLWEGWTKNFYLAAGKNLMVIVFAIIAVALVFVIPWLGLGISSVLLGQNLLKDLYYLLNVFLSFFLSIIALFFQYFLRQRNVQQFHQPLRYWSLTGVAGLILIALIIVSVVKTETGWGWTWRGRSLTQHSLRN